MILGLIGAALPVLAFAVIVVEFVRKRDLPDVIEYPHGSRPPLQLIVFERNPPPYDWAGDEHEEEP